MKWKSDNHTLKKYEDLFSSLACMPRYHHIQLDPPFTQLVHALQIITVALQGKLIRRQTSSTDISEYAAVFCQVLAPFR